MAIGATTLPSFTFCEADPDPSSQRAIHGNGSSKRQQRQGSEYVVPKYSVPSSIVYRVPRASVYLSWYLYSTDRAELCSWSSEMCCRLQSSRRIVHEDRKYDL